MPDALRITGNGRTLESPSIPGFQITGYKNSSNLADVWGALQLSLDRNVEIWVLKSELATDTAMAANYEEIARSISRIKHPNFVQIIDISRTPEGIPFTVFEEIDGVSLTTELERSGKIDQKKAAGIVMEIARVLDSAWKQCGLVHRNIKPDTVFLARGTGVKITNFNSATLIKAGRNPLAFDDGMIIGTPNYQSPEQIECSRTIDFHADMYSAGALFYEMITGEAPFGDEEDPLTVMDLQRAGTLPNPREADKSIKPGIHLRNAEDDGKRCEGQVYMVAGRYRRPPAGARRASSVSAGWRHVCPAVQHGRHHAG
jgi:serine/threonine protein kinase